MSEFLRRVRPTRMTLLALAGFVWAVTFGALRDFVWADLRAGMINLRGLTRPTRAVIVMGFTLLLLMLAALMLNDAWRATSPLIALTRSIPGRGALLPQALLPLTLFLLAVAWAYILTGALHSHPLIRVAVLLLFLPAAGLWLSTSLSTIGLTGVKAGLLAGVVGTLAVPVIYLVRWRKPARPVAEFAVLLGAAALLFVSSHAEDVYDWRTLGMPVMVAKIEAAVGFLDSLIMPLLTLIGLDIAAFAQQASHWTTEVVTKRFPRWFLMPALGGLLLFRLIGVIREAMTQFVGSNLAGEAPSFAGALAVPILIVLTWWGIGRIGHSGARPSAGDITEETHRIALPLILAFYAVEMAVFLLLWLSLGLLPLTGLVTQITAFAGVLGQQTQPWRILLSGAAVAGAVLLAQRGRRALALYLGLFGVLQLWYELTNPGHPLAVLGWRGHAPVDLWLVMGLAGMGIFWLLRRQLTPERAARLLFVTLITGLLRQTAFIESPFSPVLGFAGVGFVAFGILWDAVTAGSWANTETAALPRVGRIFLYLGYVLLTVATINWALTAHNLFSVELLTGRLASVGLDRFGKPLLYAVMIATLTAPLTPLAAAVQRVEAESMREEE